MDETQKLKIASIKDEIEQGTYWVDETAVADAIMRRLREIGSSPARGRPEAVEVSLRPSGT